MAETSYKYQFISQRVWPSVFWHSPQFYILSPRIGCFKPFSCTHTFGTLLGTHRLQFNQSNNHTHWECIQKYDLIYNRFVFSFSLSISFVPFTVSMLQSGDKDWWQRLVSLLCPCHPPYQWLGKLAASVDIQNLIHLQTVNSVGGNMV